MATGKRYYWIKLKEAFMSSDTVDFLMGQPDGANYVVLYQMLCLKTINTGGKLSRQIGEIIIPYDIEKIQRDCKWFSIDTIRVALNLYKSLGLVYEDQDGVLVLSDHQNLVGSETNWAQQKRKQKLKSNDTPQLPSGTEVENFHPDNRDKILDNRDKDKRDIELDISADAEEKAAATSQSCPFKKIKDMFNRICVSYSKIRDINGTRKTNVAARWRECKNLETFEEVFTLAESSEFMKKGIGRWANFDWMMKPNNFSKILEHRYDNDAASEPGSSMTPTVNVSEIERQFMQAYTRD